MAELLFDHSADRFRCIIDEVRNDENLDKNVFPGFADLLDDVVSTDVDVDHEQWLQRLLKVFKASKSDGTYSQVLNQYEPNEQQRIRDFVENDKPIDDVGEDFKMGASLGARTELPFVDMNGDGIPDSLEDSLNGKHHKTAGEKIEAVEEFVTTRIKRLFGRTAFEPSNLEIFNDVDRKVKVPVYIDKTWQNWGRTVENLPSLTFIPSTSYAIQEIVKFAKKFEMNVRASGYRHSWSPVFGKNGQIIISTLGLTKSTMLPNLESLPGSQYFVRGTELNAIDFAGPVEAGKKRLVRVGTSVTNQMFRRWCNSQKLDNASSLPLNVIMVEITLGGSNAPICHGAGRTHCSLSDLVHAIEYVDPNGNMQTLSKAKDPNFMVVAGGCFGLLGIVTHITLELDPMSYAVMIPRKIPVMEAIPPPPGLKDEDIPKALRIEMTPEEREQAQAEFEKLARNSFYSEWFWFPYTSKVWVNCWDTTNDETGAKDYPSGPEVFKQFVETFAIQILQQSEAILNLENLLPWAQTTLISRGGLHEMPDITNPADAIKTQLPNGLHFRRAIQNVRVRDMEIEIPIQPKKGLLKDANFNDEIDFSYVQKAWWDAILVAYEDDSIKTCPQRMPLEMRITGPSNITMAPFRGNHLGTCSIEVLTLEVMHKIWTPYAQRVLNKWMDLKDPQGNFLNSRPHWAKEWKTMKVRGQPMLEYLKHTYRDAIAEFKETRAHIASQQGWDPEEGRQRFSNDLFDELIFGQAKSR